MFSKLGKTSLAIIYLAFAIIFLFRRAHFSIKGEACSWKIDMFVFVGIFRIWICDKVGQW